MDSPPVGATVRYRVRARSRAGTGPLSPPSDPQVVPAACPRNAAFNFTSGECECGPGSAFGTLSVATRTCQCAEGQGATAVSGKCVADEALNGASKCEQAGWEFNSGNHCSIRNPDRSGLLKNSGNGIVATGCDLPGGSFQDLQCAEIFGPNLAFPPNDGGTDPYVFNCDPTGEIGAVPATVNLTGARECSCAAGPDYFSDGTLACGGCPAGQEPVGTNPNGEVICEGGASVAQANRAKRCLAAGWTLVAGNNFLLCEIPYLDGAAERERCRIRNGDSALAECADVFSDDFPPKPPPPQDDDEEPARFVYNCDANLTTGKIPAAANTISATECQCPNPERNEESQCIPQKPTIGNSRGLGMPLIQAGVRVEFLVDPGSGGQILSDAEIFGFETLAQRNGAGPFVSVSFFPIISENDDDFTLVIPLADLKENEDVILRFKVRTISDAGPGFLSDESSPLTIPELTPAEKCTRAGWAVISGNCLINTRYDWNETIGFFNTNDRCILSGGSSGSCKYLFGEDLIFPIRPADDSGPQYIAHCDSQGEDTDLIPATINTIGATECLCGTGKSYYNRRDVPSCTECDSEETMVPYGDERVACVPESASAATGRAAQRCANAGWNVAVDGAKVFCEIPFSRHATTLAVSAQNSDECEIGDDGDDGCETVFGPGQVFPQNPGDGRRYVYNCDPGGAAGRVNAGLVPATTNSGGETACACGSGATYFAGDAPRCGACPSGQFALTPAGPDGNFTCVPDATAAGPVAALERCLAAGWAVRANPPGDFGALADLPQAAQNFHALALAKLRETATNSAANEQWSNDLTDLLVALYNDASDSELETSWGLQIGGLLAGYVGLDYARLRVVEGRTDAQADAEASGSFDIAAGVADLRALYNFAPPGLGAYYFCQIPARDPADEKALEECAVFPPTASPLCADIFGEKIDDRAGDDFPPASLVRDGAAVFNCDPDDETGLLPATLNTIQATQCLCKDGRTREQGCRPGKPSFPTTPSTGLGLLNDIEVLHRFGNLYGAELVGTEFWRDENSSGNFVSVGFSPETRFVDEYSVGGVTFRYRARTHSDRGPGEWSEISDPVFARVCGNNLTPVIVSGRTVECRDPNPGKPEISLDQDNRAEVRWRAATVTVSPVSSYAIVRVPGGEVGQTTALRYPDSPPEGASVAYRIRAVFATVASPRTSEDSDPVWIPSCVSLSHSGGDACVPRAAATVARKCASAGWEVLRQLICQGEGGTPVGTIPNPDFLPPDSIPAGDLNSLHSMCLDLGGSSSTFAGNDMGWYCSSRSYRTRCFYEYDSGFDKTQLDPQNSLSGFDLPDCRDVIPHCPDGRKSTAGNPFSACLPCEDNPVADSVWCGAAVRNAGWPAAAYRDFDRCLLWDSGGAEIPNRCDSVFGEGLDFPQRVAGTGQRQAFNCPAGMTAGADGACACPAGMPAVSLAGGGAVCAPDAASASAGQRCADAGWRAFRGAGVGGTVALMCEIPLRRHSTGANLESCGLNAVAGVAAVSCGEVFGTVAAFPARDAEGMFQRFIFACATPLTPDPDYTPGTLQRCICPADHPLAIATGEDAVCAPDAAAKAFGQKCAAAGWDLARSTVATITMGVNSELHCGVPFYDWTTAENVSGCVLNRISLHASSAPYCDEAAEANAVFPPGDFPAKTAGGGRRYALNCPANQKPDPAYDGTGARQGCVWDAGSACGPADLFAVDSEGDCACHPGSACDRDRWHGAASDCLRRGGEVNLTDGAPHCEAPTVGLGTSFFNCALTLADADNCPDNYYNRDDDEFGVIVWEDGFEFDAALSQLPVAPGSAPNPLRNVRAGLVGGVAASVLLEWDSAGGGATVAALHFWEQSAAPPSPRSCVGPASARGVLFTVDFEPNEPSRAGASGVAALTLGLENSDFGMCRRYGAAAVNWTGKSAIRDAVVYLEAPPSAPRNLLATLSSGGAPATVFLEWENPANLRGATVLAYEVFRQSSIGGQTAAFSPVGEISATLEVLAFSDDSPPPAATVKYKARALSSAGPGEFSAESAGLPIPIDCAPLGRAQDGEFACGECLDTHAPHEGECRLILDCPALNRLAPYPPNLRHACGGCRKRGDILTYSGKCVSPPVAGAPANPNFLHPVTIHADAALLARYRGFCAAEWSGGTTLNASFCDGGADFGECFFAYPLGFSAATLTGRGRGWPDCGDAGAVPDCPPALREISANPFSPCRPPCNPRTHLDFVGACVPRGGELPQTAQTCRNFGGQLQDAPEKPDAVCSGMDFNDTFCLIGQKAALPCRGLFSHIRACNALNRPALDPFHCAAKCPANLQARGARCEGCKLVGFESFNGRCAAGELNLLEPTHRAVCEAAGGTVKPLHIPGGSRNVAALCEGLQANPDGETRCKTGSPASDNLEDSQGNQFANLPTIPPCDENFHAQCDPDPPGTTPLAFNSANYPDIDSLPQGVIDYINRLRDPAGIGSRALQAYQRGDGPDFRTGVGIQLFLAAFQGDSQPWTNYSEALPTLADGFNLIRLDATRLINTSYRIPGVSPFTRLGLGESESDRVILEVRDEIVSAQHAPPPGTFDDDENYLTPCILVPAEYTIDEATGNRVAPPPLPVNLGLAGEFLDSALVGAFVSPEFLVAPLRSVPVLTVSVRGEKRTVERLVNVATGGGAALETGDVCFLPRAGRACLGRRF